MNTLIVLLTTHTLIAAAGYQLAAARYEAITARNLWRSTLISVQRHVS